ncbi:radical SAM/SPASM domain-containing protein [Gordonibacter massiliensis (ex Traore et al. 2017)]|uniref:Radical SAM protein n=1 Tax=Gordonibacter massiliensis (ex Traore et al. 2017) TaxID=1841863 RepID=A0A842JD37_9ACTN|nr:radical SAM protein [Gordonibacter massiliensis (ex Traore et al. 2017)]MBC2888401.1 radical SAM protein [Gordonibacter massiliensis (ex Traore et al. 2017)]
MRFGDQVVAFDFAGIPMVGNMNTGYAIGLTAEGAAVCDRLQREDVAEPEIAAVDAALLEHLTRGGFFSNEKPAEAVVSAYLHVTQRCNLSCVGCYSFDDQRNCLEDAPLDHIKHALDELAGAGLATLIISGGEPFLRADLPDIVAYAKRDCGIRAVTVLSNGTCMTDEALAALAPNVDCVSVSFDGCSASAPAYIREEQRFDELVAAVKAVQAAGIREAHIIPTVHAKNVDDLKDYVRLSKDLGATLNFSLLTCAPDDELAALLPDEAALRKLGASLLTLDDGRPVPAMDAPVSMNITVKRNCGAGYRGVSVAADGTVYPCHMLHRPELAMGNVFTGTLAEALESEVSATCRALDAEHFEGCSTCRYGRICGGGCRARSLFASGSLESQDSYCAMTMEFYDKLGAAMNAALEKAKGGV